MSNQERDEMIALRRKAQYAAPFDPGTTPERAGTPESRAANALEYIAAQMGKISERLESIDKALAHRNWVGGQPPFPGQ
jgi:hypothetical protein